MILKPADLSFEQAATIGVAGRTALQAVRDHATSRGIGVVSCVEEALDVIERAQEVLVERRGRLNRLIDWFQTGRDASLPLRPEAPRPKPSDE